MHIDTLQLRDNQNKLLTVSGDLGVRATQVETVNLTVAADDFKVIDNDAILQLQAHRHQR